MRKHLSAYAYPRKIEFVEDLPKTLTGKIRRIETARSAAGGGIGNYERPVALLGAPRRSRPPAAARSAGRAAAMKPISRSTERMPRALPVGGVETRAGR